MHQDNNIKLSLFRFIHHCKVNIFLSLLREINQTSKQVNIYIKEYLVVDYEHAQRDSVALPLCSYFGKKSKNKNSTSECSLQQYLQHSVYDFPVHW